MLDVTDTYCTVHFNYEIVNVSEMKIYVSYADNALNLTKSAITFKESLWI